MIGSERIWFDFELVSRFAPCGSTSVAVSAASVIVESLELVSKLRDATPAIAIVGRGAESA